MTSQPNLRAAVVGLGRMGLHHVRACTDTPGIDLVAVLDHKADLSEQVAQEFGAQAVTDLKKIIDIADLAIIAVPTQDHAAMAVPLLNAGVACLVEKPVAMTEKDAQAMITAAEKGDACLGIGHVERFNPAVVALGDVLNTERTKGEKVKSYSARRLNMPSERTFDVDAVLDLMIHDLDLLNTLDIGTVTDINCDPGGTREHLATTLTLDSGVHVSCAVSREATEQDRSLCVETTHSKLTLDFTARSVTRTVDQMSAPVAVENTDALRSQLASFRDLLHAKTSAVATGQEGLAALTLANRIRASAGLL